MKTLRMIVSVITFLMLGNCSAQKMPVKTIEKNLFSYAWAEYINKNPGSKNIYDETIVSNAAKSYKEAFVLNKQKKYKEAIAKYEEVLTLHATGLYYYDFGNSLSNVFRDNDAIIAYEIAIRLGYDKPHLAYYNIACSYSKIHNADKAYEYLEKAASNGYVNFNYMKIDGDLAYLRKQLGWQKKISGIEFSVFGRNPKMPHGKSISPNGAADVHIYSFCNYNKIIYRCDYSPCQSDRCTINKYGTWYLNNNTIYIHYTMEYHKGDDKTTKKAISEDQTIDWQEVIKGDGTHFKPWFLRQYSDCSYVE